jgi:hypothetical protein
LENVYGAELKPASRRCNRHLPFLRKTAEQLWLSQTRATDCTWLVVEKVTDRDARAKPHLPQPEEIIGQRRPKFLLPKTLQNCQDEKHDKKQSFLPALRRSLISLILRANRRETLTRQKTMLEVHVSRLGFL